MAFVHKSSNWQSFCNVTGLGYTLMTAARSGAWRPHPHGMGVHRIDEHRDVLGRCVLVDPVAQVEDMRGSDTFTGVGRTEAVQHLDCLCLDLVGLGEQHIGVQVALQGFFRLERV